MLERDALVVETVDFDAPAGRLPPGETVDENVVTTVVERRREPSEPDGAGSPRLRRRIPENDRDLHTPAVGGLYKK